MYLIKDQVQHPTLTASGQQPVGRGTIVGLLAKCIGPHNVFYNKVNMGRVCHFFSRVSIILTLSLPRLCSLKILVLRKNFVKNCSTALFYLCLINIFDTNFF